MITFSSTTPRLIRKIFSRLRTELRKFTSQKIAQGNFPSKYRNFDEIKQSIDIEDLHRAQSKQSNRDFTSQEIFQTESDIKDVTFSGKFTEVESKVTKSTRNVKKERKGRVLAKSINAWDNNNKFQTENADIKIVEGEVIWIGFRFECFKGEDLEAFKVKELQSDVSEE